MSPALARKPVYYDSAKRRVWIYGQRCHHGATGVVLAGTGAVGLAAAKLKAPSLALLFAMGSLLMVHDWKDRSIWFQRGWQDQA